MTLVPLKAGGTNVADNFCYQWCWEADLVIGFLYVHLPHSERAAAYLRAAGCHSLGGGGGGKGEIFQVLAIHTYILSDHRFYTHKTLVCRFVRLGVPTIELDAQGRSRPSICSLYNWRYRALGNLPHVLNHPDYQVSWDHSTAGKLGNFTLDLNQSDY